MWFLAAYCAAFVFWGAWVYWLQRAQEQSLKRASPFVFAVAAASGLVLLILPPLVSTDVYRYLWDGSLTLGGINPYTVTPQEIGPGFNEALYGQMDWKDQYTVYPPLAQLLFAGAYALYSFFGLWAGKLVIASGAVVAACFLYKLLPQRVFLAALLNPLLLFEAFNGAHLEAWVVAALLGAYYFFQKGRYGLSSTLLAAAILIKLYPLIFAPLFVFELWRRKGAGSALGYGVLCGAIMTAFFLPLLPDLLFLIERYREWTNEMIFNASLYAIFKSSLVSLAVLAVGIGFISRKKLASGPLLAAAALFIVSSSVVYPWYTLPAFLFLLLFVGENTRRYPLLYVCALLQFLFSLTYLNVFLLQEGAPDTLRTSLLTAFAVVEYGVLFLTALWVLRKELFPA